MCKTSPIIIGFITFSAMVALVFSGCLGPLDMDKFLAGEKVQNIIHGGNDGEEEDDDLWDPQLTQNGTPIAKGEAVTIFISGTPDSVTISVANAENFEPILWFSNSIEPLKIGDSITVSSNVAPFNAVGNHLLSVTVVDQNGASRSSFITIRVEIQ